MLHLLKPACSCMTAALAFLAGKFPVTPSWGCPLKMACFQKTRRGLPELCMLLTIDFQVSSLSLSFFTSQHEPCPSHFQILQRSENAAAAAEAKAVFAAGTAGLSCVVPFVQLSVAALTEPPTCCVRASS